METPSVPPPVAAPSAGLGRKIFWATCVILTLVFPVFLVIALPLRLLVDATGWDSDAANALLVLAAVVGTYFVLRRFIRLGFRRDWPARRWQLIGWGIPVALMVVFFAVLTPLATQVNHASKLNSVFGNLRDANAAIDQFFREHASDRIFVTYDEIVGPNRPLKELYAFDGEDYRANFPYRIDSGPLVVKMSWGQSIARDNGNNPAPPPTDGVQVEKRADGSRFETTWRNGQREGPFHAYRADGKLWVEAEYHSNQIAGPVWTYAADGTRYDQLDPAQTAKGSGDGRR